MSDFHVQLNHVTVRDKGIDGPWGYVLANCPDPRFVNADVIEVHGWNVDDLAEIEDTIGESKSEGKRLVVTNDYTYKKEVQNFEVDGVAKTSKVVKLYLKGEPVFAKIDGPKPLGLGNLAQIRSEKVDVPATESEDENSF